MDSIEGMKARDSRVRCPYCHEQLDAAGEVRACLECETLQHRECWLEYDHRCAVCQAENLRDPDSPQECEHERCQEIAVSDFPFEDYSKFCLTHARKQYEKDLEEQKADSLRLMVVGLWFVGVFCINFSTANPCLAFLAVLAWIIYLFFFHPTRLKPLDVQKIGAALAVYEARARE